MDTDIDFLDEVAAFLGPESLPDVVIPREAARVDNNDQVVEKFAEESPQVVVDSSSAETDSPKSTSMCGNKKEANQDDRRKRYRNRVQKERQELKRMEKELTLKKQELIDTKEGRKTTPRTDLVVSNSFWQNMAIRQREDREQAETEQKRLVAAVHSQALSIKNLCAILRERSNTGKGENQVDNYKWIRLKSSDTDLFNTFIQEADDCYARIDQTFAECGMASQPLVGVRSVRRYSPDAGVEFAQYVNKILQPFNFEATCSFMWEGTDVAYRQHDRKVYEDVGEPDNTSAIRFRLKKTLTSGSAVSILKRVTARRYFDGKRMVIVFRSFSEGEGIFSGMDADETAWCSIRPCEDGAMDGAVMEFCSRQLPVPFLTTRTSDSTLKEFQNMLEDVMKEDENELVNSLQKLLIHGALADAGQ